MDNDTKIGIAQRDIRAAYNSVQQQEDTDTREALCLALNACELLAAIVSDQEDRIGRLEDVLQAHLETEPRRR